MASWRRYPSLRAQVGMRKRPAAWVQGGGERRELLGKQLLSQGPLGTFVTPRNFPRIWPSLQTWCLSAGLSRAKAEMLPVGAWPCAWTRGHLGP